MIALAILSLLSMQDAMTPEAPRWLRQPAPDYPDFAAFIGVDGRVNLRCVHTAEGRLRDCQVLAVSPDGLGFETAALASMPQARVTSGSLNGQPMGGTTQFAVNFRMSEYRPTQPKRAPYLGPAPSARAKMLAATIADQMAAMPMTDDLNPLGGLDPERRAIVEPWVAEALPDGRDISIAFFSRYLSEADLERILAGQAPLAPEPTITDLERVLSDFLPEDDPTDSVRARYCAAYACEIEPAPPVADPAADQGSSSMSQ